MSRHWATWPQIPCGANAVKVSLNAITMPDYSNYWAKVARQSSLHHKLSAALAYDSLDSLDRQWPGSGPGPGIASQINC